MRHEENDSLCTGHSDDFSHAHLLRRKFQPGGVFCAGPGASGSSAAAAPAAAPAPSKAQTKYYNFGASPATAAMYPLWVGVGKAVQEAYPEYQITVSEPAAPSMFPTASVSLTLF
jgi:hypothetical protein